MSSVVEMGPRLATKQRIPVDPWGGQDKQKGGDNRKNTENGNKIWLDPSCHCNKVSETG